MYLLDTHVILWWLGNEVSRFSGKILLEIQEGGEPVFVSAASAWEIAIKKGLGKLNSPDDFDEVVRKNRFLTLPISLEHAWSVIGLPRHHNDPFDRLLIAQALAEKLTLITADKKIQAYPVRWLDPGP